MKRIYVGAIVLLIIVIAAAMWWKVAHRGCKSSADCKAGAACSEGKCAEQPAAVAAPGGYSVPGGYAASPTGAPTGACTPQQLSKIKMMDTTANVAGVGQAIVKPSACESDPTGEWLLFQLADAAGSLGSSLRQVDARSNGECAEVCARDPNCATWVMNGGQCSTWSRPPELIVGAMASAVGVRAAALQ